MSEGRVVCIRARKGMAGATGGMQLGAASGALTCCRCVYAALYMADDEGLASATFLQCCTCAMC